MSDFSPAPAALRLLLSTFLTMSLVDCNTSKGTDSAPTTRISSLTDAAATCAESIRGQMKQKTLLMKSVRGLETEVAEANNRLRKSEKTTYGISQAEKQTTALTVGYEHRIAAGKIDFNYNLATADKDSGQSLSISLTSTRTEEEQSLEITQHLYVSSACDISLNQTRVELVSKIGQDQYSYSSSTTYSDDQTTRQDSTFKVPSGGSLINFQILDSPEDLRPNSYAFLGELGLLALELKTLPPKKETEFGMEFNLKVYELQMKKDGQIMASMLDGFDRQMEIERSQTGPEINWKLPKALWEQQNLGSTQDVGQQVKMEWPADYLTTHDSFQILSNKELSYDHLDAYWTLSNRQTDEKTKMTSYTVTEKSVPVITDRTDPRDLATNSTIQTQLPEIQKIARAIQTSSSGRKDQIRLILKYLNEHYTYDYDMVKNNIVRALTTQEALDRHKGVCQHYAVLFTSIARALKIPSRIVVGYAIWGDSPGGHAWVEAEVAPHQWQVIEPQKLNGLTETNTRNYLPTGRGMFLEDRNVSISDYVFDMLNRKIILRPL